VSGRQRGRRAAAGGGGSTPPEPLRPAPAAWKSWSMPCGDCGKLLQHQTGSEGAGAGCHAGSWCESQEV
jgi:hypothetical protein